MDFDRQGIEFWAALGSWALVVLVFAAICLFVGVMVSVLVAGFKGPGMVAEMLFRGLRDLFTMSLRRVGAIARLTFDESVRRKTLWVGAVFIVLFMFAHWFIVSESAPETAAKRHIVFVMTAVKWLLIPVAVLLSCWGLPADIKDRSLHTVVTKPTRRSEVVLGRMVGYSAIMLLMLVVMSFLGYVWILRSVPERAQAQLIARVPVYAPSLYFLDRSGVPQESGINVGDIWEFRGFIEGLTNARAVYNFDVDTAALKDLDELPMEYNFEAFRTHKGIMGQNVRFSLHFVNPEKNYSVKYPAASEPIQEFAADPSKRVLMIPRTLSAATGAEISLLGDAESAQQVPEELDLFDDIVSNGRLQVRVSVDDGGQYLGMARPDLFFRLPDRSFTVSYMKTIVGIGLMLILIVVLGTAASTFVKGPVATLLLGCYLLMGQLMRGYWDMYLEQYRTEGRPLGGGLFESIYRIHTQNNQMTALEEGRLKEAIEAVDEPIIKWMAAVQNIIPDFRRFDGVPELANGFDVPFDTVVWPAILITIGFLIPCLLVGTWSLLMRELEAK